MDVFLFLLSSVGSRSNDAWSACCFSTLLHFASCTWHKLNVRSKQSDDRTHACVFSNANAAESIIQGNSDNFNTIDPFHGNTFLASKAQLEFITLMTAAFDLGEPVSGLWYCSGSRSDMAYRGT